MSLESAQVAEPLLLRDPSGHLSLATWKSRSWLVQAVTLNRASARVVWCEFCDGVSASSATLQREDVRS
jgi:hypothetical protein